MNAWDLSGSLVRLVILSMALVAVPFVRRWAGGRVIVYVVLASGLMGLLLAEGIRLFHFSMQGVLRVDTVAWDSVYIHGAGYLAIVLGITIWIREVQESKNQLKRDNTSLHHLAATDFLTDLLSRRQAMLYVDHEMARSRRSGKPIGFIMIDLDHFKQVNDTRGHQAGDAVLVHVAKLLRNRLRATDIVARFGGEEFLAALPEADLTSTVSLANSLRLLIHQNPATFEGAEIPVRASFGVAMVTDAHSLTIKDVIGRADAALYTAKALGGDSVVTWEEVAQTQVSSPALAAAHN